MNVKSFVSRRVAVSAGLVLALGCGVSAQASATGPRTGNGKAQTSVTHGSGGSGAKGTVAACSQQVLGVSAVKEPADSVDARHLLLSVQNAGDKKCNLYRYPLVRLGDGRTTAPVIEESDPNPGVPLTLAPGEEAYAALLVNGPMDEYEAKSITLTLQGRKAGSTAGGPIDVPMPVETLYANDFQRVTYWTTAPGYALDFIMSK
ncbi:hypothetical protein JCM4814A_15800 [Streptomyces phaeofaciens JCM 4814]|uniref:DUF4232 domain-containing protein n=1 Tax=Streptomyces phaeofaciens TaxID=68254 RepID=A0A918HBL1_9ACTN|nr:DUF4232 domain-containing protein [Streptomyces phaeofaciens]GGT48187.1 hypothetical protein GCM10010226_26580 [Streptomyces phaeofaciens]